MNARRAALRIFNGKIIYNRSMPGGLRTEDRTAVPDAAQLKAVNVAAAFLARQMEE